MVRKVGLHNHLHNHFRWSGRRPDLIGAHLAAFLLWRGFLGAWLGQDERHDLPKPRPDLLSAHAAVVLLHGRGCVARDGPHHEVVDLSRPAEILERPPHEPR